MDPTSPRPNGSSDADYTDNFANNCDFATGDYCQSKHHTVIAATWASADKSSSDTTQQQQQSGLSTSDKIGIISGTVGDFVSVLGVWFAWKMYQKKKKKKTGGGNNGSNMQLERMHGGPNQRPWEVGMQPSALENKNIIFTRTTFSFSNIAHITTERWEARERDRQQAPRRPRALLTRAPRVRVYDLEEGAEPD
ncbi:hypothetical protein B0T22DRAFT_440650 [Podospora appendiculata]|uniref:Uncharacterized protein n=1 Tax=Podospora appendiculata TaxID=314037 RepID=A0AAE0XB13_9PEZI|nr:hypothetical protein B0T22DRAFT_440650 [Podospora appendiculata]